MARAILVLALLAGSAHAGPLKIANDRVTIRAGLTLSLVNHAWFVERKPLRAPVVGPPFETSAELAAHLRDAVLDGDQLTIHVDNECDVDRTFTIAVTIPMLEARLANVEGLGLHLKHDFVHAEPAFERATKLDPDFELAALNLASARALQGKTAEAVAALASRLAAQPEATYARIASDPELATLLDAPEVRAIRAPKAGSSTVAGIDRVAYSPSHKLLAATKIEVCPDSRHASARADVFFLAADGSHAFSLSLGPCVDLMDDVYPTTGAQRFATKATLAIANKVLADLGFDPIADLERTDARDNRASLPKARLALIGEGHTAHFRLVRGNQALVEKTQWFHRLEWMAYVPGLATVVFGWSVTPPEASWCPRDPFSGVSSIVVP